MPSVVLVHAVIYKLATGVRINVRAMGKYRGATQRATNVARGGKEIPLESFPSFCQRNAYPPFFLSSLPLLLPPADDLLSLSFLLLLARSLAFPRRAPWKFTIALLASEEAKSSFPRSGIIDPMLFHDSFLSVVPHFLDALQTSVIQCVTINSLIYREISKIINKMCKFYYERKFSHFLYIFYSCDLHLSLHISHIFTTESSTWSFYCITLIVKDERNDALLKNENKVRECNDHLPCTHNWSTLLLTCTDLRATQNVAKARMATKSTFPACLCRK